jgi:hypothetical protein
MQPGIGGKRNWGNFKIGKVAYSFCTWSVTAMKKSAPRPSSAFADMK